MRLASLETRSLDARVTAEIRGPTRTAQHALSTSISRTTVARVVPGTLTIHQAALDCAPSLRTAPDTRRTSQVYFRIACAFARNSGMERPASLVLRSTIQTTTALHAMSASAATSLTALRTVTSCATATITPRMLLAIQKLDATAPAEMSGSDQIAACARRIMTQRQTAGPAQQVTTRRTACDDAIRSMTATAMPTRRPGTNQTVHVTAGTSGMGRSAKAAQPITV